MQVWSSICKTSEQLLCREIGGPSWTRELSAAEIFPSCLLREDSQNAVIKERIWLMVNNTDCSLYTHTTTKAANIPSPAFYHRPPHVDITHVIFSVCVAISSYSQAKASVHFCCPQAHWSSWRNLASSVVHFRKLDSQTWYKHTQHRAGQKLSHLSKQTACMGRLTSQTTPNPSSFSSPCFLSLSPTILV